jgi:NAD(P)-dependent dehydrogenase (short-subunit alcohol dehydrogenase family)
MRLADRVAIVTGGGRGIGRAIALRLAREGADVAVAGTRQEALDAVALEIRSLGRRALPVCADVSHQEQVEALAACTRQTLGPVAILVNNAGIAGPTAPVSAVQRADWDEVLAVNLTGPYLCAQAVLPDMIARKSGKILNIGSVAGREGYALRSPYCVSKWGLVGLTLTLAKEVGAHDIQVNLIAPGPVAGDRIRRVIVARAAQLGRPETEVEAQYVGACALGRMVREEDVAALAAFLVSAEADNITGQAIDITAGYGL